MVGIISLEYWSAPAARDSGGRGSIARRRVAAAYINNYFHLLPPPRPRPRPPPHPRRSPCHSNTYADITKTFPTPGKSDCSKGFMTRHSRLLPYFRKILLYLNPLTKA